MENRNVLKQLKTIIVPAAIVLVAIVIRLLPHPANFAPIGALALFGGVHFKRGWEYIIPLAAMVGSDIVLGFHSTMPYVYLSFVAIIVLGKFLRGKESFFNIAAISITSSLLFFLVTNFGVWVTSSMYTKDFAGLIQSYIMGLPFLRNTLVGDLFYTLSFFYGYRLLNAIAKKYLFATIKNVTH